MYRNCFDSKVSYNCLSNFYQFFYNLGYNSENSVFSQPWTNYFVMNSCLSCCAQTVTYDVPSASKVKKNAPNFRKLRATL